MKPTRFITENSIYEIKDDGYEYSWTRIITTDDSGPLRSSEGRASSFSHHGVGSPLCMLGHSLSGYGTRVITTSPIVEIQEAVSVSF